MTDLRMRKGVPPGGNEPVWGDTIEESKQGRTEDA